VTERRGFLDRSGAPVDTLPPFTRHSTSRGDLNDRIRATGSSYGGSQRTEDISTVEHAPPWPKQGPASYFPSIEKKYGRSIAEWQQLTEMEQELAAPHG
jgi:hypothetical protein